MTFVTAIYVGFPVGILVLFAIATGIAIYLKRKEEKEVDEEQSIGKKNAETTNSGTKNSSPPEKKASKSSDTKANATNSGPAAAFKKNSITSGQGIGGTKSGMKTSGMGMTDVAW